MKTDSGAQAIWEALVTLEDHFAQLGGTARYRGFQEEDVPYTVAILLMEQLTETLPNLSTGGFVVDNHFWKSCAPVQDHVRALMKQVAPPDASAARRLLRQYVAAVEAKLKSAPSIRWQSLRRCVDALGDSSRTLEGVGRHRRL
ncbi:MAG: hypothetical protein ACRD2L_14795 [Terriglobia bacterium]